MHSFLSYLLGQSANIKKQLLIDGKTSLPLSWYLPSDLHEYYVDYFYKYHLPQTKLPVFYNERLTPNLAEITQNGQILQVGKTYSVPKLITDLQKHEWQKSSTGVNKSQFLHSGDTLYFWHKNWVLPVRIEFWGDKLEAIRVVDRELKVQFDLQWVYWSWQPLKTGILGWGGHENSIKDLERITLRDPQALQKIVDLPQFANYEGELTTENRRLLLQQIGKQYLIDQGYTLWVSTRFPEKIKRILPYLPYKTTTSLVKRGFMTTIDKVILLTDYELWGTVQLVSKSSWFTLRDKLQIGDYVVHQDHGIGKYLGIKRLLPNENLLPLIRDVMPDYKLNTPISYLQLDYAGGDELLVPIFQSQKLTRYLASDKHRPQLTPLRSGRWQSTKKRVKKAIEDISQELIQLYTLRNQSKIEKGEYDEQSLQKFIADFEFTDTADQSKVTREIVTDLMEPRPMDRLLVGDVGFGKTEVAMRAAFVMAMQQKQVLVIAPTLVLTQQHFLTFQNRFRQYGIKVALLNRSVSKVDQKRTLECLAKGKIDIIVGTHRLLSTDIKLKNLGLFIVDEEQSFGVKQKEKLKSLRLDTHVLSISATPIPRTLNFSLLGLRSLSVLTTAPKGRKAVKVWVGEFKWDLLVQGIKDEVFRQGQIIVVYNRVLSMPTFVKNLQQALSDSGVKARLSWGHGQMGSEKLLAVMSQFYAHEIDILVATTIIQSGLDIPNANTMFIVQAQRFGLAQLYQLKGRIGRSSRQAFVYLMMGESMGLNSEASYKLTDSGEKRLEVIEQATELGAGMSIASHDMAIRGVGNLLGKQQHGYINAVGFGLYQQMLEESLSSS